MDIGLGSLVVASRGGLIMLVTAVAGEEMYCVSIDRQKTVRQWCHKSALHKVARQVH